MAPLKSQIILLAAIWPSGISRWQEEIMRGDGLLQIREHARVLGHAQGCARRAKGNAVMQTRVNHYSARPCVHQFRQPTA